MIRLQLQRLVVAIVAATLVIGAPAAAADDRSRPSRSTAAAGATASACPSTARYGRAEAGHSYDEILDLYYAGHQPRPVDDVRRRRRRRPVATRSSVADLHARGSRRPTERLGGRDHRRRWLLGTVATGPVTATIGRTASGARPAPTATAQDSSSTRTATRSSTSSARPAAPASWRSGSPVAPSVLEEAEGGANVGESRAAASSCHPAAVASSEPGCLGGGCGAAPSSA